MRAFPTSTTDTLNSVTHFFQYVTATWRWRSDASLILVWPPFPRADIYKRGAAIRINVVPTAAPCWIRDLVFERYTEELGAKSTILTITHFE